MNSRIIKRVSYAIARYIAIKMNETHAEKYVYYYALQVIIGMIIETAFIYIIAWLMGILVEALICSAAFATIRRFAGGFHQDTYTKCFCTTSILILSTAFLAKNVVYNYTIPVNSFLFILSMYFIYKYAPCDTINKPILSLLHRRELRNKALALNSFWLWVSTCCIFYMPTYAPAIGLGAFVEALVITPCIADISPLRREVGSADFI